MKKLRILVVDDLFVNRLLLIEYIKSLGYESFQAENGEKALELLKNNNIDLIIMDIEMPVMNGFETCNFIRKKMEAPKSGVPIVALTAHNPNLFPDDFKDAGFDELLSKPYSIDKLNELISNLT